MLIIIPFKPVDKYVTSTVKSQCCTNELFTLGRDENNEDYFLLHLLNLQREQQIYTINRNSKISTYLADQGSGYSNKSLENI